MTPYECTVLRCLAMSVYAVMSEPRINTFGRVPTVRCAPPTGVCVTDRPSHWEVWSADSWAAFASGPIGNQYPPADEQQPQRSKEDDSGGNGSAVGL
jgi:hypothetical protein